jgi:hypothetical protein
MQALEFEAEVQGSNIKMPDSLASRFPKLVKARVILLMEDVSDDSSWRQSAYSHFLSDDTEADAVYDRLS